MVASYLERGIAEGHVQQQLPVIFELMIEKGV
jgi:hypothetical protein